MLNLDTHIVLFILNGQLRPSEKRLLKRHQSWSASAIVLWELVTLVALGRVAVDLDDPTLQRLLDRLYIWPIDLEVARATTRLDFRADPADQLIAATSIVHEVPLLTRDRVLRGSRIVPLA